jgi:carboxymethylenebutenolidase
MGKMIDIPGGPPAYEVQPDGECRGGLLVIHEVWGLTDHIKDVAERFAREGYYVLAPDLISDTEIAAHLTPNMAQDLFNPEKRNAIQPKLRGLMAPLQAPGFAEAATANVKACFDYLYQQPVVAQRVAVAGYCFGGTYSYNLAVAEPRLKAAVPFYGHASQSAEELRSITCPILAFLGEQDERLVAELPDLQAHMQAAGVDFKAQVYPDCGHAFFNDSNPFAYNAAAAKDAWRRTLEFLDQQLPA